MAKTKEELKALKEEVETVNEKLQELTEEELEQVTGGNTDFIIGQENPASSGAQTISTWWPDH